MHETSLIKNMLSVVADLRREQGDKPVKKITVEVSEFGAIGEDHFRSHFEEETRDTDYKDIELEIKKIPFGVDARLVSVTFSPQDGVSRENS